jgi:hypothetical protein
VRWWGLARLRAWWLVAALAAVGIAMVAFGQVRSGGYLLAAALMVGAAVRAAVSHRAAGGIAVRRRWVDIVTLLGLAFAVATAFALVRL